MGVISLKARHPARLAQTGGDDAGNSESTSNNHDPITESGLLGKSPYYAAFILGNVIDLGPVKTRSDQAIAKPPMTDYYPE